MLPFRPIFSLPGRLQRKLKPFLGSSPYNSCFPPELIVLVLPAKTDFFSFPAKTEFSSFTAKIIFFVFFMYCTVLHGENYFCEIVGIICVYCNFHLVPLYPICARIYRPSFHENKPKTLVFT